MYAGTKITIGGAEYIVPPVSLGQLRNGVLAKLQEHDQLLADGKIFEATALRGEVILAALRRNYPDFAEDTLMDHLDMRSITPIWLAVLGASGFAPGETAAAAETAPGTSAPSTEA